MTKQQIPFSDLSLSRRLERAEGRSNADFIEARTKLFPESDAEWIEVAGAYAMFDGMDSPLTQTFGLGVFEPVTESDLEEIENFFQRRGAHVHHEVSPLAGPALTVLLNERGYQPIELSSVMYRPIERGVQLASPRNEKVQSRLIRDGEEDLWAQTAAKGWSELVDFADIILQLSFITAKRAGGCSFLAEIDGRPIATGAMFMHDGVALLAGASTIPEGRRQGAQLALLESRLRYAAEHGCDLAMMCASPGSASQRNAERQGFRIAYTRIKWGLTRPSGNYK
ncbi:MAG TPA: GNAT family N-acetyltransferase [Blastocatellia bacterium]|nr:GNAT family N-acetyltransferase [Blastocatellia bacterium]